jgi:hypothetical protein
MNIKQVFTYLEVNLLPDKGGRVQFITEDKKEILRIFIFDEKFFNFKYIFSFVKEQIEKETTFRCFIKSGFSGIDHELKLAMTDDMFQGIKEGLHSLDAMYMRNMEVEITNTDYVETTDAEIAPDEVPNTTIPEEILENAD